MWTKNFANILCAVYAHENTKGWNPENDMPAYNSDNPLYVKGSTTGMGTWSPVCSQSIGRYANRMIYNNKYYSGCYNYPPGVMRALAVGTLNFDKAVFAKPWNSNEPSDSSAEGVYNDASVVGNSQMDLGTVGVAIGTGAIEGDQSQYEATNLAAPIQNPGLTLQNNIVYAEEFDATTGQFTMHMYIDMENTSNANISVSEIGLYAFYVSGTYTHNGRANNFVEIDGSGNPLGYVYIDHRTLIYYDALSEPLTVEPGDILRIDIVQSYTSENYEPY